MYLVGEGKGTPFIARLFLGGEVKLRLDYDS